MKRQIQSAVLAAAIVPMFSQSADAANKTWAVAASDFWTTAAAWNTAGAPANGDTVLINVNSAGNYLVNYDNPSTTQVFPTLTLNNTGGGVAQMRTNGGTVYNLTDATIGDAGAGQWQIGNATANVSTLTLGRASAGVGTATISSGTLAMSGRFVVGDQGSGAFTQTGGTVSAPGVFVDIGQSVTGSGTYTVNSGTINSGTFIVGGSGSGVLNLVTGVVNVSSLRIALNPNSNGVVNMSGGTITSTLATILAGGTGSTAAMSMTGGALSSGSLTVGNSGSAALTQSAGTVTVVNQLTIASIAGSNGAYNLQGGMLSAGSIVINAGGSMNITGSAELIASTLTLNTGGVFSQAPLSSAIDTFVHNGGTVTSNYFNTTSAEFIHNGGAFLGRLDNLGVLTLNADMTMGNGLEQRSAAGLTIAAGRTLTLDGQGLDLEAGTLFLLGTLNCSNALIGGLTAASTPVFAHQGGVHTVSNELRIGDGASAGTYNLNAGTLNMAAASIGASVGVNRTGQLNIVNGRMTVSHLRVGNGAAGTVNHSGGGDVVATNLTIGNVSAGTYLQNSVGATVNVSNGLTIGALGRYNLTNGSLTAGQTANNGSFTQTGGVANLNQVSGLGRMDVTNTASLSVDRIRNDFLFVADTARIFTTANGGANGVSRLNSLFFEDFENLNFFGKWDLNNNDLVIDTDLANQPDEYDRTKRYIQSGFSVGSWTGNGLNSSAAITAAATANKTGLGYARAVDVLSFSGGTATFVGQTVDDTTVLVRYTLLGDGDLDGTVDITDFAFLASNFNTPGDWRNGDFNYDFQVNINDFALQASNFNKVLAGDLPRGAAVPEPATAALLGVFVLGARKRR